MKAAFKALPPLLPPLNQKAKKRWGHCLHSSHAPCKQQHTQKIIGSFDLPTTLQVTTRLTPKKKENNQMKNCKLFTSYK